MKKLSEIANFLGFDKGLTYVTIGNLLYTGLGALLWFYLASQLDARDYGQINYEISVASILTAFGILGFDTTLTTFVAKGIQKMIEESTFLVLLAAIGLALFVYILFSSVSLVLLLVGMIFFTQVTSELLGKHQFKKFMVLLVVQRVLTLVLVPILFDLYGLDGAIFGFAVAHLVLCYRFVYNLKYPRLSISTLRPIRNFFFHSYALGVAKVLPYFADKLIIFPLFGLAVLGYYQFGIQMLIVSSIIPVILYNYLLPKEAKGMNQNSGKTQRLGIISAIVMTALLIGLMPKIIDQLFPSFRSATIPVQIILLASTPLAITAIYNSRFMASEKSSYVILAAGIFVSSQYLLIIVLGSAFGLIGLSISMVVASVIQSSYLHLMRGKIQPISHVSTNKTKTTRGSEDKS